MNSDAQNKASFKDVDLTGAKVTGNVVMGGASFDGVLEAGLLQVGGILGMASITAEQGQLQGRESDRCEGHGRCLDMNGASFEGALNAYSLKSAAICPCNPTPTLEPASKM